MTVAIEIVECGRTIAGPLVAFNIEWEGDLENAGSVTWAVRISSRDQSETVELAFTRDGSTDSAHVSSGGTRHDVPADASVSERDVTARFPADEVGVAVEWPIWLAVVAVDGETVAEQVIPLG